MKAKELIKKLQEAVALYGDREVKAHVVDEQNNDSLDQSLQWMTIRFGTDCAQENDMPDAPLEIWCDQQSTPLGSGELRNITKKQESESTKPCK